MLHRIRDWLGAKPRIDVFAKALIQEFAKNGSHDWTYEAEASQLLQSDGATVNLVNMFRQYSQSPISERHALLEKYANIARIQTQTIPTLWEVAAKSVFPLVRDRYDQVVPRIKTRDKPKPFPAAFATPLAGDLEIRLGYDWGTHISQVSAELVDTWGQTKESVLNPALKNLAALKRPTWIPEKSGVYSLSSDEGYQETMILLDKVIADLPLTKGPPAVFPSNRGVLLACDFSDTDAVIAMIDRAVERHNDAPWPLSASVLLQDNGSWKKAELSGLAAAKFGDLERLNAAAVYADQKTALEDFFQNAGRDVFVGTYGLVRRPQDGGAVRSWCSWSEGVETLLPRTDYIVFVDPLEKPFLPRGLNGPPHSLHSSTECAIPASNLKDMKWRGRFLPTSGQSLRRFASISAVRTPRFKNVIA